MITEPSHARGPVARVAAGLLLVVLAGCGGTAEPPRTARRTIPVAEVPAPVLDAAKAALPGIAFDEAWKNVDRDGNLQSYEVRGRGTGGKIREVRVSTAGEVLEME